MSRSIAKRFKRTRNDKDAKSYGNKKLRHIAEAGSNNHYKKVYDSRNINDSSRSKPITIINKYFNKIEKIWQIARK